jgi:hypothetical protein
MPLFIRIRAYFIYKDMILCFSIVDFPDSNYVVNSCLINLGYILINLLFNA